MKNLVEAFPGQMDKAIEIGKAAKLRKTSEPFSNVLISGLGGSGIGGTIISQLTSDIAKVPVLVNKDYFLPAFVSKNTLVIISSYSGNTEETISALEQALERKAKIVCITSGGRISEIAQKNDLDLILIPSGMPPRSCLGYSLTQLFFIFNFFELIGGEMISDIESISSFLRSEESSIKKLAKDISNKLLNKVPVIYCDSKNEGIAIRFRQQLNENSKELCWHHVFPEMNHNELVGWASKRKDHVVIILRDPMEFNRISARIEISKPVFEKYAAGIIEIESKGNSQIQKSFYLINLTDWISCFLADLKGIDPTEIAIINHLKSELAKI